MQLTIWSVMVICLPSGLLGFCTESDPYCLACDPLSRLCIECAGGYLNQENKCQTANSKVNFCFSYRSEGQCRICQFGYYLTNTGICMEIEEDDDCIIFDQDTQMCSVCKDGMLPDQHGKCDDDLKCEVPNCKYCYMRGQTPNCIECDEGFTIVYQGGVASCIKETPTVSNCNTLYSHDNLKCFICDAPYYNFNGSCLKSDLYSISKSASILTKTLVTVIGALCMFF